MKIFNKLDRYITDKTYKIIIKPNTINIINYIEIKDFSNNKKYRVITIKINHKIL